MHFYVGFCKCFIILTAICNLYDVCVDSQPQLRQLAYVSSLAGDGDLTDSMLYDIAQTCQIRNASNNVTGLLIYRDGSIWQIIEGSEEIIETLFSAIQKDPRHKNIIVVLDRKIYHRDFVYWNFAFRNYSYTHVLQKRLNQDEREHCSEQQLKDFDYLIQQSIGSKKTNVDTHNDSMSRLVCNLISSFQRTILRYEPHQRSSSLTVNIWSRPTLSRTNTDRSSKGDE